MDSFVTVFLKHGDSTCAKRISTDYAHQELVRYACSRWSDLTSENILMAYQLRGSGEVALYDDEDMGTMMSLMMDRQIQIINVVVSRFAAQTKVSRPDPISQQTSELVEYGGEADIDWNVELPSLNVQNAPRLRSEEWREKIRGVGQCFPGGAVEFRKALAMFSIPIGFSYKMLRNDKYRVTAECKLKNEMDCRWRIHASVDHSDQSFYIRNYDRNHSCSVLCDRSETKTISIKIIVDLVCDDVRAMPTMTPVQVKSLVKKDYDIDISYTVAWKATDRCRSLIFGDHSKSFSLIRPYFDEVERTNPGSYTDLQLDEANRFSRCFFAFAASLDGFKHCRPLLMVDGTFLKGKHKGILLSAVGKDGNEGTRFTYVIM